MNIDVKLEGEDGAFVRPRLSRQRDAVLELPLG